MFRKLTIALIATAALGTAALAPTSASAWHGGGGGWGGGRGGYHGGWGGFHGGWGGYGGFGGGSGFCFYHPNRCGSR